MEILSRKVVTAFLTLVLCLLLSQTVRADSAGTTEPVVTSPSTTENKEKITSETHTSTEVVETPAPGQLKKEAESPAKPTETEKKSPEVSKAPAVPAVPAAAQPAVETGNSKEKSTLPQPTGPSTPPKPTSETEQKLLDSFPLTLAPTITSFVANQLPGQLESGTVNSYVEVQSEQPIQGNPSDPFIELPTLAFPKLIENESEEDKKTRLMTELWAQLSNDALSPAECTPIRGKEIRLMKRRLHSLKHMIRHRYYHGEGFTELTEELHLLAQAVDFQTKVFEAHPTKHYKRRVKQMKYLRRRIRQLERWLAKKVKKNTEAALEGLDKP